jgi:peptide/nickel transport system substrate-binding protein
MMRRRAVCSAMVTLLLAGCGHPRTAQKHTDGLIVARLSEPLSLNPLYLQGVDAKDIGALLYSSLTRYDSNNHIVPDVATTVPSSSNGGISRDGRQIVYHLRRDVKWQDGHPLTAADVVFTYRASINPANALPTEATYDSVASVSACDRYTVCVTLKRPYAPIVATFFGGDGGRILPQHVLQGYRSLNAAAFNVSPVGSGPYRVEKWIRGDRLDLVANGSYYGGRPKIDRISIHFVPSHATILNELRSGEIDATFSANPAEIASFRSLTGDRVIVSRDRPSFTVLALNLSDPIVRVPEVRRALLYALDRAELAKKATSGLYDANTGMRGLFGWAYDPSADTATLDVRRARSILTDAGWKVGNDGIRIRSGARLSLQLVFYGQSFAANAVVPLIIDQARAAGIEIDAKPFDVNQLYARNGPLYRRAFQLALLGLESGVDPNPAQYLACNQRTPIGFNFATYCNASVDRAIGGALATYDPAVRRRLYADVQRALVKDVPYIFLWQSSEVDVVPRRLSGYEPNAAGGPYTSVAHWWLAQSGG